MSAESARTSVLVCVTPVFDVSVTMDVGCLGLGPAGDPPSQGAMPPSILNPADEAAVRAAAHLAGGRDRVIAVHVGGRSGEAALRDALAHGAGRALLLEPPLGEVVAAQAVAEAVGAFARVYLPRWVLCGQATLDWGNGLVGPTIAELLGWPVVDQILEIEPEGDGAARCIRLIASGVREELRVARPAVLAISPFAFRPTLPPLRERFRAQRATIEVRAATVEGALPRLASWSAAPPRPRPKAALPPDYSDWSPEDRLRFLTESARSPARTDTRWLRGDAREIARELLNFIEQCGARVEWKRP